MNIILRYLEYLYDIDDMYMCRKYYVLPWAWLFGVVIPVALLTGILYAKLIDFIR